MYKVNVGKKILSANEEYALKNSQLLAEQKKLCLNMMHWRICPSAIWI